MATNKTKITKRVIDSLKRGEVAWDSEIAGFGARCQVKAVVYILKTQVMGRQRWLTIGKHGSPWTPNTARDRAKVLLGMIADNKDPATLRDNLKGRPTVADLCDRFIDDYAIEHKKASSVKVDRMNICNHILPILGRKYVSDVTLSDIDAFKRAIRAGKTARGLKEGNTIGSPVKGGKYTANRCLALLSTMFNMAIKWGICSDNPVRHVEKYKEKKIERYLSEIEFSALAEAIEIESQTNTNPYPVSAIKLLIFTGARCNEILTLKWADVDIASSILSLGDSKTGSKTIFLNAPAKEVLANLPRQDKNPYVICGAIKNAHLVNISKPWIRVRDIASVMLWKNDPIIAQYVAEYKKTSDQLPSAKQVVEFATEEDIELTTGVQDMRLHDLRHSFASVGAMGGLSLPMIGKLLGHTQTATTERYAHLADDPLRQANDAIGRKLQGLMQNKGKNFEVIKNG